MKRFFMIGTLVWLLIFAACGGKKDSPETETDSSALVTESQESTEETEENPQIDKVNPLQMEGYISKQSAEGEFELLGELPANALVNGRYLSQLTMQDAGDGWILVCYVTMEEPYDRTGANDAAEVPPVSQHITSWNRLTGEKGEMVTYGEEADYVQCKVAGDKVWVIDEIGEEISVEVYSVEMKLLAKEEFAAASSGCVSTDGETFYYTVDQRIYGYDLADKTSKEVSLNRQFAVNYISGALTDEAGQEYLCIMVMAEDLNYYMAVVNLQSGDPVYLKESTSYAFIDKNIMVENEYDLEGMRWTFAKDRKDAATYRWLIETTPNLHITADQEYFFTYHDSDYLMVTAFEGDTNQCIGHGKMSFPEAELSDGSIYSYSLFDTPIAVGDGTYILCIYGPEEQYLLYRWTPDETTVGADYVTITKESYPDDMVQDIPILYDPLAGTGEVTADLAVAREYADWVEEKFHVEIRIGGECGGIFGDYMIVPLEDAETVMTSLKILAEELEKYPDGFFEEFYYYEYEGLRIQIGGTLQGISGSGLDVAGGYHMSAENQQVITVDCKNPYDLQGTIHHEICHAIEEKIMNVQGKTGTIYLDMAEWEQLNPPVPDSIGSWYSYSYQTMGHQEGQPITYIYYLDQTIPGENIYFIDDYSMTYPDEDRARLFEHIMYDDSYVNYAQCPHLLEKLKAYSGIIREVFDSADWENVWWERLF